MREHLQLTAYTLFLLCMRYYNMIWARMPLSFSFSLSPFKNERAISCVVYAL
jgi:hypothetical protein